MAMTEKQGGSDLRSNITVAEPAGGEYRLTGHTWFCSAPMSDAFLVVAQALAGPTAFLVGDEGRGIATIARMVNLTRLDCVLGSAGLIRQATAQALHHARYRSAFGARLADQPLMSAVLAELVLESESESESEASTALALRLAGAVDRSESLDDQRSAGGDARLDGFVKRLSARLLALSSQPVADVQRDGRGLVESMAVAFQGALLVRHAPSVVSEAFCASRFAPDATWAFGASGTAIPATSAAAIIDRATPRLE